MCNVYSIGIEDEPRAGPSKGMDRLFAVEPEEVEEVVSIAELRVEMERGKWIDLLILQPPFRIDVFGLSYRRWLIEGCGRTMYISSRISARF